VIKVRLRARKIDSKIFMRGIFSLQFTVRPHLAGHHGFVLRARANDSARIIRMGPMRREPKIGIP
jgi:hypothetical protein